MQVGENRVWIKNVGGGQDSLGRAEDIGEGRPDFASVSRPDGEGRCRGTPSALCVPEDEGRLDEADEGGDSRHGLSLARAGICESEELLQVARAGFDSPALGIALQNLFHRGVRVHGEEDAQPDGSFVDPDDDDAKQTNAAGAVPLGAQGLGADDLESAAKHDVVADPRDSRVFGQGLGSREALATDAGAARGAGSFRGRGGEDRIRTHGPVEPEVVSQAPGHRGIAVCRIGGQANLPVAHPPAKHVQHPPDEFRLLPVDRIVSGALLLAAVKPEQQRQRPCALRERQWHDDGEHDPAVAEAEDPNPLGGPDRVEMIADPEHMRPALRGERVVHCRKDRRAVRQEPEHAHEEEPGQLVGAPRATREETVECLVMSPPRDPRDHQGLGHRVQSACAHPPGEHDQHVAVPRLSQRRTKHLEKGEQCGKKVSGHGFPPAMASSTNRPSRGRPCPETSPAHEKGRNTSQMKAIACRWHAPEVTLTRWGLFGGFGGLLFLVGWVVACDRSAGLSDSVVFSPPQSCAGDGECPGPFLCNRVVSGGECVRPRSLKNGLPCSRWDVCREESVCLVLDDRPTCAPRASVPESAAYPLWGSAVGSLVGCRVVIGGGADVVPGCLQWWLPECVQSVHGQVIEIDEVGGAFTSTALPGLELGARAFSASTSLNNDRFYVFGGMNSLHSPLQTVEVYDRTMGRFVVGPDMAGTRMYHSALWIPSLGAFFVAGGIGSGFGTWELWTREAGTIQTGNLAQGRSHHSTAVIKSEQGEELGFWVAVVGGLDDGNKAVGLVELYRIEGEQVGERVERCLCDAEDSDGCHLNAFKAPLLSLGFPGTPSGFTDLLHATADGEPVCGFARHEETAECRVFSGDSLALNANWCYGDGPDRLGHAFSFVSVQELGSAVHHGYVRSGFQSVDCVIESGGVAPWEAVFGQPIAATDVFYYQGGWWLSKHSSAWPKWDDPRVDHSVVQVCDGRPLVVGGLRRAGDSWVAASDFDFLPHPFGESEP